MCRLQPGGTDSCKTVERSTPPTPDSQRPVYSSSLYPVHHVWRSGRNYKAYQKAGSRVKDGLTLIQHINRLKKKNHIIIAIGREKAFNKIHLFMIKTLRKLGIEGNLLNLMKNIYKNTTANIVPNSEKLKPFPLRSETRQACVPPLLFNAVLEVPADARRQGNERYTDGRGLKLALQMA